MSGLSQGWYDFAQHFNMRAEKIHKWANDKGFWDFPMKVEVRENFHTLHALAVPAKLALIHSEISEALEADRHKSKDDKLVDRDGLEVELADAVIRIMDLAHAKGYNLGETIAEKMAFNEGRPYKHGKDY